MKKIFDLLKKYYLIVITIFALLITLVVELGVFNFYELTHRSDKFITYNLSEIETKGFTLKDNQLVSKKKSSLHIDCQNEHVSKLNIYYIANNEFNTKMTITYKNGKKEVVHSANSMKMTIISRNIHKDVKEIDFSFDQPIQINADC